jgi:hypothetical protein
MYIYSIPLPSTTAKHGKGGSPTPPPRPSSRPSAPRPPPSGPSRAPAGGRDFSPDVAFDQKAIFDQKAMAPRDPSSLQRVVRGPPRRAPPGVGFRVWGLVFFGGGVEASGLGFRVHGFGFRASGFWLRVYGRVFSVDGLWFMGYDSWFMV